jgi:(p)ppGpp synthase/HD superfamily hydrolase
MQKLNDIYFSGRDDLIEEVQAVLNDIYSRISRDTPISQIVSDENLDLLSKAVNFDVHKDQIRNAIGFQAREMIKADNGEPKKRYSGNFYATHPICVAIGSEIIAKDIGVNDPNKRDRIIKLGLLHDVIEEGFMTSREGIVDELGLNEYIFHGVELLDVVPRGFDLKSESGLSSGNMAYALFAYSFSKMKDVTLPIVELNDRFEQLIDYDYLFKRSNPANRIITTMAERRVVVDAICDAHPKLSIYGEFYARIEKRMLSDKRAKDIKELCVEKSEELLAKIKDELCGREGYFKDKLNEHLRSKGISSEMFFDF